MPKQHSSVISARIARRKNPNEQVLRPVHPNWGLAVAYKQRLLHQLDAMQASLLYWLTAAWRKHTPIMAQDVVPAAQLRTVLRRLARRWQSDWNAAVPELARYFAQSVNQRSDADLRRILRNAGISIEFTMTPAMRDVLHATIGQNVALIKSIPQQYLGQVEQLVMRAAEVGGDLAILTRELERQFGVTRRRATLIAHHQTRMATAAMTRARQIELGIAEAVWLHSHGGNQPRRTHLANHGKRYNVVEGWFDPDPRVRRHINTGELINCRCVNKAVIPGFS